jgi:hypothetical protein
MNSLLSKSEASKILELLNDTIKTKSESNWLQYLIDCYIDQKPVDVLDRKNLRKYYFTKIEAPAIKLKKMIL